MSVYAKRSEKSLKIGVLGKGMVGKSSLTYAFMDNEVSKVHDPTIEDKYKRVVEVEGVPLELEILDTAGQDDFQTMIDSWINYSDCFLLVFALNDLDSFKELEQRKNKIQLVKRSKDVPILLVGNKVDLKNEIVVTAEMIEKVEKEWNCEYMEASALKKINSTEIFIRIAELSLSRETKKKPKGCPIC